MEGVLACSRRRNISLIEGGVPYSVSGRFSLREDWPRLVPAAWPETVSFLLLAIPAEVVN